jgi:surface antigen
MKTTRFGYEIVKSAEEVLEQGYRSRGKNYYGEKLEEIVKEFDKHGGTNYFTGKGKKQVDYCAITASVILDRALRNYDGSNNIIRSASANTLAGIAKSRGVRVDKTPAIGSLFIYERNDKGQGHIGFVWKVNPRSIASIEGNTESCNSYIIRKGCPEKLECGEYGILTRLRNSPYKTSAGKQYYFIHIEELFDKELMEFPDTENYLADGDSCEIMNWDENNIDEGSDGDREDPVETAKAVSFFETHKDKIVLGGGNVGFVTDVDGSKFETIEVNTTSDTGKLPFAICFIKTKKTAEVLSCR